MTLFDLVIRSMRKNIKLYYLYFFALIFSVVLYFVFATLQHDPSVIAEAGFKMTASFRAAGILLLFIAGIFVFYANMIFLKRRSREIGLYQLIGLQKRTVARLLIIENILLSAGALAVGIGIGILVSRVFLLLLMKLIGAEGFIEMSFSTAAVFQTALVFVAIIIVTSMQMLFAVYRSTLIGLFTAEKTGEHPKKPKAFLSALLAAMGIGMIAFGYYLSGRMLNDLLFFNMIAVLATTIGGTYLVFRVTISYVLYIIRKRKSGHIGLSNSLSIAPIMHRMKSNANSLTIITVLSAMTLTMIAGSYSLFYNTEKETRYMMPFDFSFEDENSPWAGMDDMTASEFEEGLKAADIPYTAHEIELFIVRGYLEKNVFPEWLGPMDGIYGGSIVSARQLQNAGFPAKTPGDGEVVFHNTSISPFAKDIRVPYEMFIETAEGEKMYTVTAIGEGNVLSGVSEQYVVNDKEFEWLRHHLPDEPTVAESEDYRVKHVFQITDESRLAEASAIRTKHWQEGTWSSGTDYYSMYKNQLEANGMLIFIAGFLGLVFLVSTGSILYFKQMTEAEQEKGSYTTLRQLGFTVQDIMRGIIKKQVFVFGLPLLIGLLHSIFAIKAASFLFMSDIKAPAAMAMGLYALIYLLFAVLTIGYYRKTVKAAL